MFMVFFNSYCYFPSLMVIDICDLHGKEILFEMSIRAKHKGMCTSQKSYSRPKFEYLSWLCYGS